MEQPVKVVQPPPDVVPTHEPVEPPAAFRTSEPKTEPEPDIRPKSLVHEQPQDIYEDLAAAPAPVPFQPIAAPASPPSESEKQQMPLEIGEDEDLSQYIEDTGYAATALYDYQAAAEDEISFDPDDLITHIEMVPN